MKQQLYPRAIIFLVVASISAISIYSLRKLDSNRLTGSSLRYESPVHLKLGTFASFKMRGTDRASASKAEQAALTAIDRVDHLLSTWREGTELSQVNKKADQEPVQVSPETFAILRKGIEFSRMSGGAFDLTIAPLLDLWKQAGKLDQLPRQEAIDALPVGWELLDLSQDNRVVFKQPGMKIVVDAYVEGYAVDQALTAIRQCGIEAALVNIGGEIACYGPSQDDFFWTVGIQNPFAIKDENDLSESAGWRIRINNCSVSTSGNYRHYHTIQGRQYSHIVDPRSGQPAGLLLSVTIIAPDTMTSDALATTVSVLGPEAGMQLVESLPGVEAFLIGGTRDAPQLYRSSGFARFLIE